MNERRVILLNDADEYWQLPPWPTAFELANALPPYSWTLVGGLMVALHAKIADIPPSRPTVDVDTALHLETNAVTFAHVAKQLAALGYVLNPDTQFAYKFERKAERIDVMCSDRHAAFKKPKYLGRPLFGIPGGTRALRDTWNVHLKTDEHDVEFVLPSVLGALVLKGAAYREDSRDPQRHLEDAITLFACASEEDLDLQHLSVGSKRRIRTLVDALAEQKLVWLSHNESVRALARESLELMLNSNEGSSAS